MLKVFGSCLPEYQIMLVCFFIFLTVLYMVLVICEGTWERQRKAMLQDSALLIVIFLITFGLCVRSRVFGGEQDSMILFKIPYAFLFIMGICGFLFAGIQMFGIFKRCRNYLRENAIQESLDNLPSGIVFFDGNGMPKLMNRRMHQICMNLAGRDIQNITELEEALSKPLKEQVFFDDDLKVYGFSDGSVWKFSEKEIITTGGDRFSQVLASEVSELYQSKVLLKRENQKLQEMSAAMKELSKNVVTLTREEETLSMKMRVHDNLGYSVLAAQRMLMRELEEDRDIFLSQWKQTLDLLNKDNESVEDEQLHRQVQDRAKFLGVKIIYTGEKNWESHIFRLLDIILLEALSNCVRHAGASELYVKFGSAEHEWGVVITDNGQKPEKNIKEGGGLSGIRKRVEQCGGTLRICSDPIFSITVKIPKEVRR
ncbi:Redox sensor histidine kinase response regulator devS [uncultured Ruminococcus sp.]|nr:Redox sensor histidine kinase response regulator devS [uncultured Ruminococcus sp.]